MILKGALDGFKLGNPNIMTPNIKMILLTSLMPSDYGCRNTYLPIYSLVRNISFITNNDFYLFIQAYFYYHVIVVAIF